MRNKGFTVVEMVVVIAVLLILTAGSIIGYRFWRADAAESTLRQDLELAASALELERSFNDSFTTTMPSSYRVSDNSTLTISSATTTNFCIRGVSKITPSLIMHFRRSEGEPRAGSC